jgi:hypothetical protein
MIFFLASLSKQSFGTLENVYKKFEDAELKGQVVPRCKKGTVAKQLDLKGNQFKCLRGIDNTNVHRLLSEVNDGIISLKQMCSECVSIKNLVKVQAAFVRGTNCVDWDDVCEKYPQFTTAEKLEPYKKLDFSGRTLPSVFLHFCQRALASVNPVAVKTDVHRTDDSFCVVQQNVYAIFWKVDMKVVTPDMFMCMLKCNAKDIVFPGFSLGYLDLTDGRKVRT